MSKGRKLGRSALGRGLSALISTPPVAVNAPVEYSESAVQSAEIATNFTAPSNQDGEYGVRMLPIDEVGRNEAQPRQIFSEAEILELSESIKSLGLLQPVVVRESINSKHRYELVAGERRWRAARLANLGHIPALVRTLDDRQALEIALVENVQRENLNAIEEARGYQRLMQEFDLNQEQVAERVGKDRATISNAVRVLKLPMEVQEMIQKGELSVGHAKALLSLREESGQVSLARKTVREALSVRALEQLVQQVAVLDGGHRLARKSDEEKQGSDATKPSGVALEVIDRMRNSLGTKVSIKHHESGRGRIEIEYFSDAELDRIIDKICG